MKLLQNFFSLPPVQDEAERQTAQVLRMALLFFSILALLYGVFTTIFDLANWERYTLQTAVLFAGMMLAMFFLRRGYVRAVSLAITSFIWLVFTYSAYTGGGVRSSGYYGYLMVLVAVGVLSGRWIDTLVMTFLCLGSGYFMVYAEQNGFLPEPAVPMTSFALWLDSIFFAVVVSSLLFMTMRIKYLSMQRLNQELAERRLAEQRAARSASQLAMLNEIGRTVSEVTDLRMVLESIRQKLTALIPFDFYSVRLFDAATRMVTYLAVYESGRYWDEAPAPLQTG
ncbi:MAG: hypothetical protein RMJ85_15820, partial [Anaerolineales bacterium]|nr:hypothetical protein [Anaerolineales bacterium]